MRISKLTVFVIILLPILYYFHFRGIYANHEGTLLVSAEYILKGLIPYRDFQFNLAPLSTLLVVISFIILGESVFSIRILTLIASVLSIILLFKISILSSKKSLYAILGVILFVAWGPAIINYATPPLIALPFVFFSIYLTLLYSKNKKFYIPFLVGVSSFCIYLTYPMYVFVILPIVFHFLVIKKTFMSSLHLVYGFVWGVIVLITYLLLTGSLKGFIKNNLLTNPEITDFSTGGLGLLLLIFSVSAILLLIYRKRYELVFVPIITVLFFFANAPHIALLGIPVAIIINKLPFPSIKGFAYASFAILIVLGFQNAFYHTTENNNMLKEKAGINVSNQFISSYNQLKSITEIYSSSEYIFIDSYTYYFLLEKLPPNLSLDENQIVYSLVGKDVKLAFIKDDTTQVLKGYILKNYKFLRKAGSYSAYLKP